MELAELADQRPHRDRVLEQAAEVGVVAAPGCRARGGTPLPAGPAKISRSTTARRPGSWTSRARCSRKPSSSSTER